MMTVETTLRCVQPGRFLSFEKKRRCTTGAMGRALHLPARAKLVRTVKPGNMRFLEPSIDAGKPSFRQDHSSELASRRNHRWPHPSAKIQYVRLLQEPKRAE